MKSFILSFCFLWAALALNAQSLSKNTSPIHSVEQLVMPVQNNKLLLEEELNARRKGRAQKFATSSKVDISPQNFGTWESTKDNEQVWRARIQSKGAYSINLGFTAFELPKSARFFIYNIEKSDIKGPFTKADNEDHLKFWAPLIEGDELILELQIDPTEIHKLQLNLAYVNHDFVGIMNGSASGSCNLDVICGADDGFPEVDDNRDIIKSVGYYTIGGTDVCSGVLLNNTRNDCRPFYLTADHCGINPNNASSVVVYWNYENSTCRQPNSPESGANGDGSKAEFNSGAIFRAGSGESDFILIELDDPLNTSHNLYAAGWNRTKEVSPSAIAIHHPNLEEKRISFENDPTQWSHPDLPNLNSNDTAYVIVNDWDTGTTEGGSSGSPLFNDKKQVIGQLFGGLAACGNDRYDYYGWIGRSWEGEGTPNTQLKVWLDPDDTDVPFLTGINCSYTLLADQNNFRLCNLNTDEIIITLTGGGGFDSLLSFDVEDPPQGLNYSFDKDQANIDEDVLLTLSNLGSFQDTTIIVTVIASDGINESSTEITIEIFAQNPETISLIIPTNDEIDLPTSLIFEWAEANANNYVIQIASDEAFNNIIIEETLDNNIFASNVFIQDLTFYWRVKGINPCGDGDWSETFVFTIGKQRCIEYKLLDLPVAIGEDPVTIDNFFELDYDILLSDLNVSNLSCIHSWVNDLRFSLINPDGNSAVILDRICQGFPGFENFNLGLDEESNLDVIPCPPTDGLIYNNDSDFSDLYNQGTKGNWNFLLEDLEFFDGGQLDNVLLEFCFTKGIGSNLVPSKNYFETCSNDMVSFDLYGLNTDPLDIEISLNGNELNFQAVLDPLDDEKAIITLLDLNSAPVGSNEVEINAKNNDANTTIVLNVLEGDLDIELISPVQGDSILLNDLNEIIWNSTPASNNCLVEISDDTSFNNVIFSGNSDNLMIGINNILSPNTQYFIAITCENDCVTTTSLFDFFTKKTNAVTSVDAEPLLLYPNPANEKIFIDFKDLDQLKAITIYSVTGKPVLKTKTITSNGLDVSQLTSGIYMVKLESSTSKKVVKLMVN